MTQYITQMLDDTGQKALLHDTRSVCTFLPASSSSVVLNINYYASVDPPARNHKESIERVRGYYRVLSPKNLTYPKQRNFSPGGYHRIASERQPLRYLKLYRTSKLRNLIEEHGTLLKAISRRKV